MAGKEFTKPDNISAHQEDKTRIIAGAVSMSFRWPWIKLQDIAEFAFDDPSSVAYPFGWGHFF